MTGLPPEPEVAPTDLMNTLRWITQPNRPNWLRPLGELEEVTGTARARALALVEGLGAASGRDSFAAAGVACLAAARALDDLALATETVAAEEPPALPERTAESVATWLGELRDALHLSAAEMGLVLSVSSETVRKFERGQGSHRARMARLVAEGLGLIFADLDAGALAEELIAELDADGRLASEPDPHRPKWDEDWWARKRAARRSGPALLREKARRRAVEEHWLGAEKGRYQR